MKKNMSLKFSLMVILMIILITPYQVISQIKKPVLTKKSTQLATGIKFTKMSKTSLQLRQAYINALKYKGITTGSIGSTVPAQNRTVRDGRTTEVLPYDGTATGVGEPQLGTSTTDQSGGGVICNSVPVTLKAGFNELNLLDPNAVEIWPGRFIKISSIDDGAYTDFSEFTSRKDMRLAIIAAGTSQSSTTANVVGSQISQGNVNNALNSIKNSFGPNDFGSTGWDFEQIEYFNREQFALSAGLGITAVPIQLDIRSNASFNTGVKKNKIVLKFSRTAYHAKVDNPNFSELVEASNLSNDAGVIVSVAYGSFAIVEIESDSSFSKMNAALNATFQADPSATVTTNLSVDIQNTISNFSIKGIFRGISGNQSIQTITNINNLKSILSNNASTFTATTPVVPIAFIIKSLKTAETMMLRTTMTFTKRECTALPDAPKDIRVKVRMKAFTCPRVNDGLTNEEDIYGTLEVSSGPTNRRENVKEVWDKGVNSHVKVKQSTTPSAEGAYSLANRASDYVFTMKTDETSLRNNELWVKASLCDEEWGKCVPYETRTVKIKYRDVLQAIKDKNVANSTSSIDSYDQAQKLFKFDTVERGNTNKIVIWFEVVED